jgi:hypothetical protein
MTQVPLLNDDLLTGRDDSFIDHEYLERPVHRALVPAWTALVADARAAGFEPGIASGFRNFQRQLSIWNAKASGERVLLDGNGGVIDPSILDPWQLAQAILRWSALPGASRHHWGTDIDVYDRAAVAADYAVQLTPEEAADNGPFGAFHRWLDKRIASGESHGFFRPYATDTGGIAPERWHLSYAPIAIYYQRYMSLARLWGALDVPGLALRGCVHEHWAEIFERFVWVAPTAYPLAYQHRVAGAVS